MNRKKNQREQKGFKNFKKMAVYVEKFTVYVGLCKFYVENWLGRDLSFVAVRVYIFNHLSVNNLLKVAFL